MTKQEIQKRMKEILDKAESEKRNLTDAEDVECTGLEMKLKELEVIEGRTARNIPLGLARGGEGADEVRAHGIVGGLADCRRLFRGRSVAASDMPVEDYMRAAVEGRTMLAGVGESGGFAAPEAWSRDILQSVNAQSVALPRCRIFPMNDANTLHLSLWNSESQDEGYFGGIVPEWKKEAGTFTAKTPKMRSVTLGAHKLGLYINLSRECVQDAGGIAAEVGSRMAFAIGQTFDQKIFGGTGVAQPAGIIDSPATIAVSRAVGDQIAWSDVVNMISKLHPAFTGNSAWFANPSTLRQLLVMSDASSSALWVPNGNVASASPGMLYGRPLFLTDKIPALGTKGDLILADLSMYAIGIRSAVSVERSESPEWYADLVSLRTILRCDGCSLLDRPITPQNGNDLSAFVVLD